MNLFSFDYVEPTKFNLLKYSKVLYFVYSYPVEIHP